MSTFTTMEATMPDNIPFETFTFYLYQILLTGFKIGYKKI
jgi:hypothetical protein